MTDGDRRQTLLTQLLRLALGITYSHRHRPHRPPGLPLADDTATGSGVTRPPRSRASGWRRRVLTLCGPRGPVTSALLLLAARLRHLDRTVPYLPSTVRRSIIITTSGTLYCGVINQCIARRHSYAMSPYYSARMIGLPPRAELAGRLRAAIVHSSESVRRRLTAARFRC